MMDLDRQSSKELILSEIIVMKASRHPNIVNYIDSFLRMHQNELWLVMEYMEGGSLMDVVKYNLMTEGQIAAVSRETCQGLEHLHRHGVIHRDVKSGNVLLSLNGDIKLGASIVGAEDGHTDSVGSGLRILCPYLRECEEDVIHWHTLLDGSGGCHQERVRSKS